MADRLAGVRRRIEVAGGDPGAVRVVGVTKGFGPDAVALALAAGLEDIGENYAQELVATHERWQKDPHRAGGGARWHFLGGIQRNKVRMLAPVVDCWQSVARPAEGQEIARRRPGATVLVQVDTTGLAGRNGCAPADVAALVAALEDAGLAVPGLMTVAPPDPSGAREAFRTVRDLADGLGLPERSMGMSDDLEAAVAEGTTMVRVGRALFGERPARSPNGPPGRPAATLPGSVAGVPKSTR